MQQKNMGRPMFKKQNDNISTPAVQQLYTQQQQHQTTNNKYQQKPSTFIAQGEKINFQSQDSQGSDLSYQSSIQSQQDINIGEIQYFKQQMGRFFINYPELINDQILDLGGDFNQGEEQDQDGNIKYSMLTSGLNKNWNMLADQILTEAKESSSFLQSLSRRIALYRTKLHQQDLIDILLKQEKNIMKDIDLQISVKKKQSKGSKNFAIDHTSAADNVYLSWRKKNQLQHRLNLQKDEIQNEKSPVKKVQAFKKNGRALSANVNKKNAESLTKFHSKKDSLLNVNSNQVKQKQSVGTMFFLTSNQVVVNNNPGKTEKPNTAGNLSRAVNQNVERVDNKSMTSYQLLKDNFNANKRSFSLNKGQNRKSIEKFKHQEIQKQNKANLASNNNQYQPYWRHLVNFQPRTQGGRQLCELIRKTNTPNDELGIKKTILQFLSRNKQMVQNEMILKSTISQKIQKLYTDDSKQLLMFYPTKMSATQIKPNMGVSKQDGGNNVDRPMGVNMNSDDGDGVKGLMNSDNGPDNSHKLFDQGEKFMNLLEDIVQGPLMKYWMMIQEKKL